jgi:uncharacterized protein (DUF433 family)
MRIVTAINETPSVSGGYPCIGDTRISVRSVVQMYAQIHDLAALTREFPQLSHEQIQAALDYYRDNPERIDEDIACNEAAVTGLRVRVAMGSGGARARRDHHLPATAAQRAAPARCSASRHR